MTGQAIDPAAMKARAESGDATAQYALAAMMMRGGDRRQGLDWLERAAKAEHPGAMMTLALMELEGIDGPPRPRNAAKRMRKAVDQGHVPALRQFAILKALGEGTEADWEEAIHLTVKGARQGHAAAQRDIGMLCLMAGDTEHGDALLLSAAGRQDGPAVGALLHRTREGGAVVTAEQRAQALEAFERVRHPHAALLKEAIGESAPERTTPPSEPDWDAIAERLAEPPIPAVPARQDLADAPQVWRLDGLFTGAECAHVIAMAGPRLTPSLVLDPQTGQDRPHPHRQSSTAILWAGAQDLVIHALNLRLGAAGGVPADHGEMLSILHYGKGQAYKPHYDVLTPGSPTDDRELERSGQRVLTALVTLNDDFDGGETWFKTPDLSVKAGLGDAVLFRNVREDGSPDPDTLHAGQAVTRGDKWLASKWFREKVYVPY